LPKEKCTEWETAILLKGGHFDDALIKEALITKHEVLCFERERKNYTYNHGTGCTLSSALACFLGNEKSLKESYYLASNYLTELFDNLQIKLLR
jgi:hydroxymethylpyrimidine/phosphomethylpyrimidine kinase